MSNEERPGCADTPGAEEAGEPDRFSRWTGWRERTVSDGREE